VCGVDFVAKMGLFDLLMLVTTLTSNNQQQAASKVVPHIG
jgi:hypothetical protein